MDSIILYSVMGLKILENPIRIINLLNFRLMNQKDDYGMTIRILNGLFYNMAKTKRKI